MRKTKKNGFKDLLLQGANTLKQFEGCKTRHWLLNVYQVSKKREKMPEMVYLDKSQGQNS